MKFSERISKQVDSFVDRFRSKGTSIAISPNSTKSFSQSSNEVIKYFDEVTPNYPLEMFPVLSKLALINPDFNQSLKRNIFLMNTGFEWKPEGVSQSVAKTIQNEIDDWFDKHPGIANKLLRQTAIMGVLSAEAVPSFELDEIETVQLIPVAKVRFKKERIEGKNGGVRYKYVPFQNLENGNQLSLNEEIYTYEALETDEDSPYGIPPAISAIKAMYSQSRGMENLEKSTNKWSLLGFLSVVMSKFKPAPGTDLKSHGTQQKEFLKTSAKEIEKSIESGLLVGSEGTKIEHHSIASEKSSGLKEVMNIIEEQLSSGIDTDQFILGRPTSVTETYAKVSSKLFLMKGENVRHPVKNFLEKTLTLHLRMKGYKFTRLRASWKEGRPLNPEDDALAKKTNAEAEKLRTERLLLLATEGVIDLDTVAVEHGYEKAVVKSVSKNALGAFLRALDINSLSQEGKTLVNTYEHLFKRNQRDSLGGSEPDLSQSDENEEELEEKFQKKNGTRTNVVPIQRGRKY
ncbi:hypothetical protein [Leptospira santarosai]|uniref:Portal protein n=1 Tax=Leptospira santarosai serovar Shermani str. LT 821 TaxID=758847 RepID=K8XWN5_9LEPT|nr:hypothetical protein [Leptospira santarosai]EKT85938.1 hypothetical protein LSS_15021 [Leptospira santarosai serovar Shermani str. LT 821]EPG82302.1 hypothetical protein LEP1GSC048_0679 [Leptospira santarosai serovar Shermani str. 1342KT]